MQRMAAILFGVLIWATSSSATADITHISNGATPADGLFQLELKEQWRAGGLDEEILFGVIGDVTTDAAGNVYILDSQLCQVMVFSPDGEFLRTLSRQGEGPGEVQQPTGLVMLPENKIGIVMGYPGKIVTLTAEGIPTGTLHPVGDPADGGFGILRGATCVNDRIIACGGSLSFDAGTGMGRNSRFLSTADLTCETPIRFLEKTTEMQLAAQKFVEVDDYFVEGRWDVASNGRIYVAANRDGYDISVFDPAGQQIELIERDYQPRKRTQSEKDLVGSDMHIRVDGHELEMERFVEDHDECITQLIVRADDSLWVMPPQGRHDQATGILETWDVYDTAGAFTRQVAIPAGDEIRTGISFFLGADRLLIVKGADLDNVPGNDETQDEEFETEPIEVICYQIQGEN
jgi:6-bladed beta-propeller